jgi:hypothetical protein
VLAEGVAVVAAETVEVGEDLVEVVSSSSSHSSSSLPLLPSVLFSLSSQSSPLLSSSGSVAPEPVSPPPTPAAAIRATASSFLSQEIAVPSLLTSGRATQIVPEEHGVKAHFPPTHWANWLLTQAIAPATLYTCEYLASLGRITVTYHHMSRQS